MHRFAVNAGPAHPLLKREFRQWFDLISTPDLAVSCAIDLGSPRGHSLELFDGAGNPLFFFTYKHQPRARRRQPARQGKT
jgi:hypothetical protein